MSRLVNLLHAALSTTLLLLAGFLLPPPAWAAMSSDDHGQPRVVDMDNCSPNSISCIHGNSWDRVDENASSDPTLHSARILFNAGKFRDALVQYDKYLKTSTDAAHGVEALYESSQILQDQGSTNEAIVRLQKVVISSMTSLAPKAALRVGQMELGLQHWDIATQAFNSLIVRFQMAPEARGAYFGLIQAAYNQGNAAKTVAELRRFKTKYPDDTRVQAVCNDLVSAVDSNTMWGAQARASQKHNIQTLCPNSKLDHHQ